MTYNTTPLIGINFTDVGSNSTQIVGVRADGTDDTTWQYVYYGSAAVAGACVHIAQSGTAYNITPTLAATGGDIGFVQTASSAGEYGWVACKGRNLLVRVLADCNDNVALWTTDTAGALDDAINTLSQYQVMGVIGTSSNGGTTSTIQAVAQSFPIIRRAASGA